ncbi:methyltransferase domain-containing protein [Candidatus Woesearchaeota archaeon]|nr:methyltransferase domain-containing protein [Candidatus Woesearchaeota archaeon]
MKEEFEKSMHAAELEFKEEPMDENYRNPIVGIISRGRVKRLLKDMGKLEGKKVLDVGCEAGYISLKLSEQGADVFSFDICKPALIEFKKKKSASNIFLAAAQKMPLKDNLFDYVVCTEVIEHMPKLELSLKEMERVLKPGGKLFITFPNEKLRRILYPIAKLFGINTSIEKEVTLYEYRFKEIIKLCRKNFRIEKKYSWPFLFPLTRFVVCKK